MNRLTGKSYTDTYAGNSSTPGVKYGYDFVAPSGCSPVPPTLTDSYPIGLQTSMCDGSGATSWKHDQVGRILTERRTISGGGSKSISYTYNLDGSLATLIYPTTGKTITYTYGGAGRILSAQNSGDSVNYVLGATYAPPGGLTAMTNGYTTGNAGIHVQNSYNNRLQPLQVFRTTGSTLNATQLAMTTCPGIIGNIMHFVYGFGAGANDNGDVMSIANCRDTNRTQNFSYDNLNRISQAYTNGSSPLSSSWGETFTIDAWGNLTNRGQVAGKTNYEPLSCAPANTGNQLNGCYSYDAAGNLIQNGPTSYTYDAENRLTKTSGWVYTYDGDDQRVKKCASACTTGTLYWTGAGSDNLSESDLSGNVQKEYIYFNGLRVARRDVSGNSVHYYFSNHLGSASVVTNSVGAMPFEQEIDYYPYGGEIDIANNLPQNYKFTGQERDSESNLDNFGARNYSPSIGRFMVADPGQLDGFSNMGDPQSWNGYAYARNNPLLFVDPSGLGHCVYPHISEAEEAGQAPAQAMGTPGPNSKEYCEGHKGTWITDDSDVTATVEGDPDKLPEFSADRDQFYATQPGFLRIRRSGETFLQCVQRNSAKFSVVGVFDSLAGTHFSETFWGNLAAGNDITGLVVGITGTSSSNSTEGVAAATSVSATHGVLYGIGKPLVTSGPRGLQGLFPKVGRPAQALLRQAGLKEATELLSGYGEAKLAVDAVFAGALAGACR